MDKKLVSLITPMYNTDKYIHRLLDSVLSQDYPFIEMIVIDDGSTDNSSIIVKSYIHLFEEKGYVLKYVYQENQGQSVAIKNGLQLITGEYLAWPDSDDYYADKTAISQMVEVLKNSPKEYKMVRSQEKYINDETLEVQYITGLKAKEYEDSTLFYDCLYAMNGYYFAPGAYMVDVTALYETTGFDIYTDKNAGQNWQLMLPVLYKYRCRTIKKPLYNVVIRLSSHSRGQYTGYDATETKYKSYFATQLETLYRIKEIPISEKEYHKKKLTIHYSRKLFYQAIIEKRPDKVIEQANILRKYNDIGRSERLFSTVIGTFRLRHLGFLLYKSYVKLYSIINHLR